MVSGWKKYLVLKRRGVFHDHDHLISHNKIKGCTEYIFEEPVLIIKVLAQEAT
jgi:hypothetical protein